MRPTLLEGDVVLVNRLAYDVKLPLTDVVLAHLDEPRRGDVVTFSSPADGTRLIKRIVALPGDRVAMRRNRLFVNDEPAMYIDEGTASETVGEGQRLSVRRLEERIDGRGHDIQWLPAVSGRTDFSPLQVPDDQYLVLGDNRDNSADSRYFGFVPRHLLIGRAERVLVSVAFKEDWLPRLERFGMSLE